MTQDRLPHTDVPVVSPTTGQLLSGFIPDGAKEGSLGVHVDGTSLEQRHDCLKELTNKLAWAMGTFYGVPYSGRKTVVHEYIAKCARAILRDHGYPHGR